MQNCKSGNELTLLASAIAIIIAEKISSEDVELLAALLNAVADNLALIATKRSLCKPESADK